MMKKLILMASLLTLSACSTPPTKFGGDREIANEVNCKTALQSFFDNEVRADDLNAALVERKLLSFNEKFITVNHPKLDWYNKTKKSLINRMKNWNNNKYPLFYMDNSDNIIPLAKSYSKLLSNEASGTIDDEGKKSLEIIRNWITSYKSYKVDLDQLLDERISLEFNVKMLKEVKLNKNETRDIKLLIKRNGELVTEVVTVRSEDRNLPFVIKSLKDQILDLDGHLNKFGKIEERLINQAAAKDMVTILQRELEAIVKNTENGAPELTNGLDELNNLLKDQELSPSSYAVYKITNTIFNKELAELFHLTTPIKKISSVNQVNVRSTIEKFFKKSAKNEADASSNLVEESSKVIKQEIVDAKTTASKLVLDAEGPLKRIYAKIATFTPYQKFMATSKLAVVGYGAYRYFLVKKNNTTEVTNNSSNEVITPDQKAHAVQLDETKKIEDEKTNGHSSVIEVEIESLIKRYNPN